MIEAWGTQVGVILGAAILLRIAYRWGWNNGARWATEATARSIIKRFEEKYGR